MKTVARLAGDIGFAYAVTEEYVRTLDPEYVAKTYSVELVRRDEAEAEIAQHLNMYVLSQAEVERTYAELTKLRDQRRELSGAVQSLAGEKVTVGWVIKRDSTYAASMMNAGIVLWLSSQRGAIRWPANTDVNTMRLIVEAARSPGSRLVRLVRRVR